MGQRSQIFVRFEKELGEKEIVARYFNWNYGERMISRVYHTIAWIKAHLELTNSDPGQYLSQNRKKLVRILDTNFDMYDITIASNILKEYEEFDWHMPLNDFMFNGQDNNDGKAFIDVKRNGMIKYALLTSDNVLCNPSEYMVWDIDKEWMIPDKYISKRMIGITEEHIEELSDIATLMTEEEVKEFMEYELHFEFPVHAKKAELLEIYAKLVKTINGDDVVYLTNIQKFVDGHGATYISGTVAEPDLSDFEDDFHGNFSEFLTRCFKDRIDWYRISQNEELGKFPHGGVFGEKLELIV